MKAQTTISCTTQRLGEQVGNEAVRSGARGRDGQGHGQSSKPLSCVGDGGGHADWRCGGFRHKVQVIAGDSAAAPGRRGRGCRHERPAEQHVARPVTA